MDGANLEEITMKTVCKQVYAHYPDFDLAHKKDFIKSTVKSVSFLCYATIPYVQLTCFFCFSVDIDVNWQLKKRKFRFKKSIY